MRDILFRGKRLDTGEWVEGSLLLPDCDTGPVLICGGTDNVNTRYEVDPETVCEYTGLKDMNGTRIFEGDIVKGIFNDKEIAGHIKYGSDASFYIEREELYGIFLNNAEYWLKVTGNIFDKYRRQIMDKPLKDWTLEEVQKICNQYPNEHSYVEGCTFYRNCPLKTFCLNYFHGQPRAWDLENANVQD